jgi:peptidoglycan/LPS O-acetylase OafA/YrhL
MSQAEAFYLALTCGLFTWLIVQVAPHSVGRYIGSPSTKPGSSSNIEGLRGFLAFGVFIHHNIINWWFLKNGLWIVPKYGPATMIGEGGVALFFIITAFLFWSKVIRSNGSLNLVSFFKGRLLRIAPLYYLVAGLVVFLSFLLANFQIGYSFSRLVIDIVRWMGLGVLGTPSINGIDSGRMVAHVFWSLRWEWGFYLLLPFLKTILKLKHGHYVSVALLILYFLFSFTQHNKDIAKSLLFCGGMLAAHIWEGKFLSLYKLDRRVLQIGVSVLLCTAFTFKTAYGTLQAVIFTVLFICILHLPRESTFGRILDLKASNSLGVVSFSIYMIHGIILFFIGYFFKTNIVNSTSEWAAFVFFTLLSSVLVVCLAFFTFRIAELPFLVKKTQNKL